MSSLGLLPRYVKLLDPADARRNGRRLQLINTHYHTIDRERRGIVESMPLMADEARSLALEVRAQSSASAAAPDGGARGYRARSCRHRTMGATQGRRDLRGGNCGEQGADLAARVRAGDA
jgi:hypothetical protein